MFTLGILKGEFLKGREHMQSVDLSGVVHADPEILEGTPVFVGTRVPIRTLLDHLEGWRFHRGLPARFSQV
jgi:hypothetical protein